jgi:ribosomal protein S18 acetylase RimI-like enzyme
MKGGLYMILNKGNILKNKNTSMELEEYSMELLSKGRLNEVIELEHKVYEGLSNKDILYVDDYDEMLADMESGAKIIGVLNNKNRLIAYRYIGFPGLDNKNMGLDINLPIDELDKVVHLETTVVDPEYRGNGLQDLTLQVASNMVKQEGYRHLLCTVSPYNFFSLYNVMKNGLKIKALKKKYAKSDDGNDGLWRFILHSDLEKSLNNPIDTVISKWANLELQKELIDNGYIGYEISKETRQLNYIKFQEQIA